MSGRVLRLLRIGLNVTDLPRALNYYREALGFTHVEDDESWRKATPLLAGDGVRVRAARLRLGGQELELTEFDPPAMRYPPRSTAADLWFQHFAIVTNDMATAYGRLQRCGMTPITQGGPQRLPPEDGAVVAYKFRDPDGHPLELIHFPSGVGDPAWHRAAPGATIGIDHSALSVANVDRSLAFYDLLGLDLQSRQHNAGPQQDRLDGLFDAVVEVLALSPVAARTPHVELLCYRTPRGRPVPRPLAHGIADTRLIFQVEELDNLGRTLLLASFAMSPIAEISSKSHAAFVRDPDGHASVLLE
jgi:catechol 2,3-dioxygenase-like lactoylglutathione lyase family enzyme